MRISGSKALLTGATGGIGHALARELHGRGAELILTGRRVDVLEPLAAELGARSLAVDLGDPAAVDGLATQAGEIDILVANAALPATGSLESFSGPEIDRVLDVNLRAPIVLARALVPAMSRRGQGHLLFVSSLAGKVASPQSSLYNATKFGLRGFALALRAELHATGVGVSVVCPGFIRDAGMFADADVKLPTGVGTRSPQDVARAVAQAIERNRGEVDVAPLALRTGAILGSIVPEAAAAITRRVGGDEIASSLAAGQRDKR
jgi:short-subunit dehydrogenase